MTDIVERLRNYDKCTVGPQEAADTIEALRAENAQLVEQLSIRSESGMAKDMQEIMRVNNELLAVNNELSVAFKERDEALAENVRLREALRPFTTGDYVTWEQKRAARAAMGEGDE